MRHGGCVRSHPCQKCLELGHNALGAWWAVIPGGHVSSQASGTIWQELGNRVLPLEVIFDSAGLSQISMTQAAPRALDIAPECTSLARTLSIETDVLSVPGLTPCVVSTSETTHLLVPFRSLADLKRVQVDAEKLRSLVRPFGCEGCYCYSLDTVSRTSLAHARGFFPGIGIVEDSATGSDAGPLGAHFVANGMAPEDE